MGRAESSPSALVREFIARCNAGDPWSLLSDRVIVTVNGTTPLSGRYPGIPLVRGILLDSARVVIASLNISISKIICAGTRVATLICLSGRNSAGTPFNTEGRLCGCVFTVDAGLIHEVTLFPDTSLIEIALYHRRYVSDV